MATKYDTKKRHKTSKTGVFYRFSTTNGKKDKTFYIVYKNEEGKTVESKVGKESEGVGVNFASQKYTETLQKIKLGEAVPIKRKRRKIFTLNDAFIPYIDFVKNEKKSWTKDREIYNNHLVEFHERELVSLTKMDFEELKNEKLKTLSPRTVQYILAVARQIINFAINHDLIKGYINPISSGRVKIKSLQNEKQGFFTREQADKLLKILKAEHKGSTSYLYELTVLLLHTGARFSEVASLTWHDVDFSKNTIFFKSTKNGNERTIIMSSMIKEVLYSLQKSTKTDLIFYTFHHTQIKQMPKSWQRIVDSIIPNNKTTVVRTDDEGEFKELSQKEREQLKKETKTRLTVHSLRHTHASWMAMSGSFNLMEIRDELGHKSIKMTERYSHLLPDERHRKVHELFDTNMK